MINPEKSITVLGKTSFRNEERLFGIHRTDRRNHVYVLGKTGMGKSVLLENMAIQDIRDGYGLAIVDPHGEMADRLLDFIPQSRINDVVYINPADFDHPIAFNIMEQVGVEYKHLVASGLMAVFKKVWPDVWSARMEYILNNTLLALLEYPGSTLLGINRLLSDKDYRKKVLARVTDPVVRAFWLTEFARYNERFQVEAIAPIQNKIGQFISTPVIRNIVGQTKSSIDMREVMDSGKILIINLSKGKIGEDNSRLLGALIITKLQLAAMSRADVSEDKRNDFYLYVDEFQNFATDSFAAILSEARKYRLNLTITHQYTAQLVSDHNTKIRDAIFGNVGTMIIFRLGAEDAEFFEKEFAPEFETNDIVNIPRYNVYLKLMINGVASKAFSSSTLPPMIAPPKSFREKIIKVSRERYSKKRADVEDKISRWSEPKELERKPQRTEFKTDGEYYKAKEGDFFELAKEERGSGIDGAPKKPLFEVDCSKCGKKTVVPFEPDGKRPVYCKQCLTESKNEKPQVKYTPRNIKSEPIARETEKVISLGDLVGKNSDEEGDRLNIINKEIQKEPEHVKNLDVVQKQKKTIDLGGLRDVLNDAIGEKDK